LDKKLTTLQSGLIDDLTMSYQPGTNKLSTVTDNGQADMKHLGFNQLAGSGATAHSYDNAGNLTYDHTKKAIITYNYLNLPTTITFQNGNIIEYAYDANGKKLQTTRKTNSTTIADMHQYSDGIEYKQSGSTYLLESIYHPEGRIYNTNVTNPNTTALALRHEFSIKDHLGNSRITFSDINNNGSIQVPTEIIQENHYYPFGLNMGGAWMNDNTAIDNPYQYNGKELESFGGLGWSDYGARWYDAATARFTTVDPLAHKLPSWSPYSAMACNPIMFFDPDGAFPYTFHIRAFAPPGAFKGTGFHDDNRGFSTSLSATSRIKQNFTVDPSKQTFTGGKPTSDETIWNGFSRTATDEGGASASFGKNFIGSAMAFISANFEGSNPFFAGAAPDIEVSSAISITENLKTNQVFVGLDISSKQFPATEGLIQDNAGNTLLLAGAAAYGSAGNLVNANKKKAATVDLIIGINDKGVFQNVTMGGKTYTLEEFNKLGTAKSAGPLPREDKDKGGN
jgi:RHS repeat-associated protein